MALSITPENLQIAWKRSLAGKPANSKHVWVAVLLNGICLLALGDAFRALTVGRKLDPGLLIFFAFILCFLVLADFFVWQMYRKASAEMQVREDSPALSISFMAYRLYLLVLGVAIMSLKIIGMIH